MTDNNHNLPSGSGKNSGKNTKKNDAQRLFDILYDKPISRRMAATLLGYKDQTYMVTQSIYDWKNEGRLFVVGKIRCACSTRLVEGVTTNSKYSTPSIQLSIPYNQANK